MRLDQHNASGFRKYFQAGVYEQLIGCLPGYCPAFVQLTISSSIWLLIRAATVRERTALVAAMSAFLIAGFCGLFLSEPRASASGQVFIRAILCRDRNGAATLVKGVIPSERSESRNLHLALVWFPGAFLVAGLSGFEFRASNLFRI
ncbi:MAG: hypothetical protein A3F68_04160 [Acidobacteria bacterium RIFCSPLOWO2_12_FULL_54_10]|nr:MAG: hypothetical protein A3F68_04160 [Acidobacteria bacterium RIFCSPLOWO2_12_FULL_54_10]